MSSAALPDTQIELGPRYRPRPMVLPINAGTRGQFLALEGVGYGAGPSSVVVATHATQVEDADRNLGLYDVASDLDPDVVELAKQIAIDALGTVFRYCTRHGVYDRKRLKTVLRRFIGVVMSVRPDLMTTKDKRPMEFDKMAKLLGITKQGLYKNSTQFNTEHGIRTGFQRVAESNKGTMRDSATRAWTKRKHDDKVKVNGVVKTKNKKKKQK